MQMCNTQKSLKTAFILSEACLLIQNRFKILSELFELRIICFDINEGADILL
jgi:hypothetical protein